MYICISSQHRALSEVHKLRAYDDRAQCWNIGIAYKRAYALSSYALTYVALNLVQACGQFPSSWAVSRPRLSQTGSMHLALWRKQADTCFWMCSSNASKLRWKWCGDYSCVVAHARQRDILLQSETREEESRMKYSRTRFGYHSGFRKCQRRPWIVIVFRAMKEAYLDSILFSIYAGKLIVFYRSQKKIKLYLCTPEQISNQKVLPGGMAASVK